MSQPGLSLVAAGGKNTVIVKPACETKTDRTIHWKERDAGKSTRRAVSFRQRVPEMLRESTEHVEEFGLRRLAINDQSVLNMLKSYILKEGTDICASNKGQRVRR
jgi:hypothetical protein